MAVPRVEGGAMRCFQWIQSYSFPRQMSSRDLLSNTVPIGNNKVQCTSNIFKDFIYLFLQRREGKEKERERNISVWLPLVHPLLRTWPTTQSCALTGNQIGDPLVHRPALNLLSHTSQGCTSKFDKKIELMLRVLKKNKKGTQENFGR